MPIKFHCPSCSQRLSVSRKQAGRKTSCPRCGKTIRVPALDEVVKVEPKDTVGEAAPEIPGTSSARRPAASIAPPVAEPPATSDPAEFDSDFPDPADEEVHFADAGDEAGFDDGVADKGRGGWGRSEPPPRARPDRRDDGEAAEFQIRKPATDFEEMDLTPMVDVTFLLLIFFMLTASFSLQKTIPTPVPDQNDESASQPIQPQEDLLEKSILIEIDATNQIFLDEEPVADARALADALRSKMTIEQKAEVLVDASADAFNETVVSVLDAANEVGMQKIRMAFPSGSSGDD